MSFKILIKELTVSRNDHLPDLLVLLNIKTKERALIKKIKSRYLNTTYLGPYKNSQKQPKKGQSEIHSYQYIRILFTQNVDSLLYDYT